MCTDERPTVSTILAAIASAKAYWEADDVQTFLFGASVDAGVDSELFADPVNPVLQAA